MRAVGRREHPCNAMRRRHGVPLLRRGRARRGARVLPPGRGRAARPSARGSRTRAPRSWRWRPRLTTGRPWSTACSSMRYGNAGYGIGGLRRSSACAGSARSRSARWCATHFTRGNAGMWMTGEPPEDFVLELPDGPSRPAPVPVTRLAGLPGYVAEGWGGAALSGVAPRSTALHARDRGGRANASMTRLREEHGLAYAPFVRLPDGRRGSTRTSCSGPTGATTSTALAARGAVALRDASSPRTAPREDELDRQRRATARDRRAPDTIAERPLLRTSRRAARRPRAASRLTSATPGSTPSTVLRPRQRCRPCSQRALLLGPVRLTPAGRGALPRSRAPAGEPIDGELFVLPRARSVAAAARRGAACGSASAASGCEPTATHP